MNQMLFSLPTPLWATVFLLFPALLALNLLLRPREGASSYAVTACIARRAAGTALLITYAPWLYLSEQNIQHSGSGTDAAVLRAVVGLMVLLPIALLIAAAVYHLAIRRGPRRES